jgi:Transcriptional regulatory protein, C terminal/AAA ATPase domain
VIPGAVTVTPPPVKRRAPGVACDDPLVAARPVTPARLLERDLELTELDDALTLAYQGQGRVVLIEGPAGIGKTSLLQAACDAAAESGFTALRARATELEHDFAYGCGPGQVLSREQLLSQVWGYDFDPGSNIVDVYVGYLRKKLGKERIKSIRGMGYRLERDAPAT